MNNMSSNVVEDNVTQMLLPVQETDDYVWTFNVPPRSDLQKQIETTGNVGLTFKELRFQTGFLAETEHKMKVIFNVNKVSIDIVLPKAGNIHSYKVLDSKYQLLSSNVVMFERRLFFGEDESADAPTVTWSSSFETCRGCWKEHIDCMKIGLKFERFTEARFITPKDFSEEAEDISQTLASLELDRVNSGEFLFSDHLSDVILECKGKDFPAHRILLSCRSSVFKKMFEGLKEETGGRVEIKNMEPEVLGALLRFIYTCEFEKIGEMCKELFIAAYNYEISALKLLCEIVLANQVNVGNALDIYKMSEIYESEDLKERAIDFLKENWEQVFSDREVFNRFAACYPQKASELFKTCRRPLRDSEFIKEHGPDHPNTDSDDSDTNTESDTNNESETDSDANTNNDTDSDANTNNDTDSDANTNNDTDSDDSDTNAESETDSTSEDEGWESADSVTGLDTCSCDTEKECDDCVRLKEFILEYHNKSCLLLKN